MDYWYNKLHKFGLKLYISVETKILESNGSIIKFSYNLTGHMNMSF